MSLFDFREVASGLAPGATSGLPSGTNATDSEIFGVHFNLTTLQHWNYTLYSGNNTISNGSWCFLMDPPYTPVGVLNNGTFVNSTWCYLATQPSGPRGNAGIGVAVCFALALVLVLVNLARHGKLYLPATKRFVPIGRRWQWYWASFVCTTAIIGLFTNIDVDRYRVLELPIVLNVFFWFLMQMGTTAIVWEAVRHWGSWMERQFVDPNPFVLHQTDSRGMFEFWLPLFFYFWLWLNFFLIVPRNWTNIELQRSPQQIVLKAIPTATDGRFKAAGFCLLICWLTIMVSLWHSIRHYEPRNRGWFNRTIGFLGYMPFRFVLLIPLLLALVAYQELVAWRFDLSPLNAKTNLLAMYLGGYAPSLLIVIVQAIDGFCRPNEDKELIRQRRTRGAAIDRELGLVKKPNWWRRVNGDVDDGGMRGQIMRNVREVGGGRPTARHVEAMAERRAADLEAAGANNNSGIEMNTLRRSNSAATSVRTGATAPPPYTTAYGGRSEQRRTEHTMQAVASLLFPNASPSPSIHERGRDLEMSNQQTQRPYTTERSSSTASAASGISTSGPPQQIRSMLDI
ncbi:Uu.00g143080.m01.CDS01 [Anthostomella pinea]|uniref:Uu.00g143080.m01.CDS01 n=1 Tax=Anthostomella pinea TaxID=933095 RepID=A0AAI8VRS5_9PEZI|nr:Uu.00g143080.m01.CDS01 [Anthostomella pinea]